MTFDYVCVNFSDTHCQIYFNYMYTDLKYLYDLACRCVINERMAYYVFKATRERGGRGRGGGERERERGGEKKRERGERERERNIIVLHTVLSISGISITQCYVI